MSSSLYSWENTGTVIFPATAKYTAKHATNTLNIFMDRPSLIPALSQKLLVFGTVISVHGSEQKENP
jgi:hypothetical protein